LQSLQVSWGSARSRRLDERDEFGSTPRIRFYEFEARATSPLACRSDRHRLSAGLGLDVIRAHNERLCGWCTSAFPASLG